MTTDKKELLLKIYDDVFDFIAPNTRHGNVDEEQDLEQYDEFVEITEYTQSALFSGEYFNEEHEDILNRNYRQMCDDFFEQYEDKLLEHNIVTEKDQFSYDDIADLSELEDAFCEFESDYFPNEMIGVTIWQDGTLQVWVNYRDPEYFRTEYETVLVKLKIEEDATAEQVIALIKEAYSYDNKEQKRKTKCHN